MLIIQFRGIIRVKSQLQNLSQVYHSKIHTLQLKIQSLAYIIITIKIMQNQQNSEYRPPKTVKAFFTNAYNLYSKKDSRKLALHFKELYWGNDYQNTNLQSWNTNIKIMQEYTNFQDEITPHFVKLLELIKMYQTNKKAKQWLTAFDIHLKVVLECLELIKQIKDEDFMWILKSIRTLLRATKNIFLESMKHITTSSKVKNDLINTLNRYKSTRSLLDNVKVEIFPLVENMLVSILFTFHNYDMIKMIVHTSKLTLNPENKFRDNFLFLKAKYELVNENFKEAQQCFEMINLRTVGQKRLLLKYLIPCKIFLGKMFESRHENQNFPEYQTLIKALKSASFRDFDQAIQKYQKVWIKRGIYLLMDRLRILIWRNLIKRVSKVMGQKIMLQAIQKAVGISGGSENINECICIIGNLIYLGYIKGSIFQNQTVRGLILKRKMLFRSLTKLCDQAFMDGQNYLKDTKQANVQMIKISQINM